MALGFYPTCVLGRWRLSVPGLTGGMLPAVFNAANEVAVDAFRNGKLPFPGIWQCVAAVMDAHEVKAYSTLEAVVAADHWARKHAAAFYEKIQAAHR